MCCGWGGMGGMMGGWGGWTGWGMFAWIFGLLFNLGLLALLVLGVVWLVRQVRGNQGVNVDRILRGNTESPAGRTCPTCGRPMAAEWSVCPYDGTSLTATSSGQTT